METFLVLNGYERNAPVDEQERVMLELAAGDLSRGGFLEWVRLRVSQPCRNVRTDIG